VRPEGGKHGDEQRGHAAADGISLGPQRQRPLQVPNFWQWSSLNLLALARPPSPCHIEGMPKRSSISGRRTLDPNETALSAIQRVIALTEDAEQRAEKNPAAVVLGRRGGLKGGRARADRLSPARRMEIARAAAAARWTKTPVR